jgi:predicted permease
MLQNMAAALNAVLPSFVIIAVGMLIRRKGLVGETALNQFNSVAFRVFLATQLFKNVYDSSVEESFDMGLAVYMLVAVLLVTLLTALAVNRLEPLRERRGVMIQGIFRSNFVLLSLPLMQSLFGDAGSGMVSLMIALVVPLFNVLAVVVLETYAGKEKTDPKKILRGIVKNPLIDATMLSLLVKLSGLDLYRVSAIKSVLSSVAGAATPLCLFILGASFSLGGLKGAARSLWITVAGRLVAVPVVTIAAAALLGFRGPALGVIMVCFGAPTAVSSYNMAREIGGDADLAAGIVVVTTALSCLTLFCWIVLLKTLGLF